MPLELEADKERWVRKERVRTDGTRKTVKPYPDSRQKETIKRVNETKGTLSALCLLPDYDKFAWAVFDPMHSLLEGACKTYFHRVLVLWCKPLIANQLIPNFRRKFPKKNQVLHAR